MPRPSESLTIGLTEEEKQILQSYCEQTARQKSEVIREFIRSLAKKLKASSRMPLFFIPGLKATGFSNFFL